MQWNSQKPRELLSDYITEMSSSNLESTDRGGWEQEKGECRKEWKIIPKNAAVVFLFQQLGCDGIRPSAPGGHFSQTCRVGGGGDQKMSKARLHNSDRHDIELLSCMPQPHWSVQGPAQVFLPVCV